LLADLAPAEYAIVIGLYDPTTGERLVVQDGSGATVGNEIRVGTVRVSRR
jgi:hypothetical protein